MTREAVDSWGKRIMGWLESKAPALKVAIENPVIQSRIRHALSVLSTLIAVKGGAAAYAAVVGTEVDVAKVAESLTALFMSGVVEWINYLWSQNQAHKMVPVQKDTNAG